MNGVFVTESGDLEKIPWATQSVRCGFIWFDLLSFTGPQHRGRRVNMFFFFLFWYQSCDFVIQHFGEAV